MNDHRLMQNNTLFFNKTHVHSNKTSKQWQTVLISSQPFLITPKIKLLNFADGLENCTI